MKFSAVVVNVKFFLMTKRKIRGKFLGIMSVRKKNKPERPVFDSIRKPTAPPGQKFGGDKSDEKANPARRKIKHKKPEEAEN